MRCVSSIRCIVTALADLRCFPCLVLGFSAHNAFFCGDFGRSVYFGCYGCHCCFCRFRFVIGFFCSRSSAGSASRVSIAGHWCDDFCLPVLGPTRGFCRHRTRVFRGLVWLRSLNNGRNHFVMTSHYCSWHRSHSPPSLTASSFLTTEIPGPCGGGVRLVGRANHRGPHPKSRAYLYRTAIGVLGGFRPGPNFADFGGVWCLLSFLWSTLGEVCSWRLQDWLRRGFVG